ncbi:protein modifying enzyme [Lithospermum erythrorhizon]|uniref:Protein modifying enzyme n=1 Tax=Lithospermum erythrorhizon TaxID=34254 RepID=A0AAV3QFR6_LITER
MGLKIGGQIEKVNGKELSYSDFGDKYLARNEPVVLTGLMEDWRACHDWVSDSGKPNLDFLSTHFGNSKVQYQVADCRTRKLTDQKRVEMSVSDFVGQWGDDIKGNALLYLKDWHFVKEYLDYNAYNAPLFFRDDWLNFYLDNYHMHTHPDPINEISCSDYRFVYMGAKGTWTPLHADVFRSYSWSANVCGRKKWYFLSPSQHTFVFDRYMKNSVYDIFEEVNEKIFPHFKKAIWWECTQEENEIIFVPSGWFHQVLNLDDAISINHNWFNAYNLPWVWDLLLRDYKEAKEYIEDIKDICDDFEGLCQRNLATNTGMNFYDFFIFLVRMAFANLVQLYVLSRNNINSEEKRVQHLVFNFQSIRTVALKMKSASCEMNQYTTVDFSLLRKEQEFKQLCTSIWKTYDTLHDQGSENYNVNEVLLGIDENFLSTSSWCINSPENLISLVDFALDKLGECDGCS